MEIRQKTWQDLGCVAICAMTVCVCVENASQGSERKGRASDCWRGARSLGTRIIDSFCHTDRLWIICRHLTSWKANSGVLNFSTLALERRKLDFCVCTCKVPPAHNTTASSENRLLRSCDCKLEACVRKLTDVTLCHFFFCILLLLVHADGFLLSLHLQTLPFLRKTRVHKVKNKPVKQSAKYFQQHFYAIKSFIWEILQAFNHFIQPKNKKKLAQKYKYICMYIHIYRGCQISIYLITISWWTILVD